MSTKDGAKAFLTAYCASSSDLTKCIAVPVDEYRNAWNSLMCKVSEACDVTSCNNQISSPSTLNNPRRIAVDSHLTSKPAFSIKLYHEQVCRSMF